MLKWRGFLPLVLGFLARSGWDGEEDGQGGHAGQDVGTRGGVGIFRESLLRSAARWGQRALPFGSVVRIFLVCWSSFAKGYGGQAARVSR